MTHSNDPDRQPPTCPDCGSTRLDTDTHGYADCRNCGWEAAPVRDPIDRVEDEGELWV